MTDTAARRHVRVWDPVVRIGHWVLAGAFLTAYFSGDEFKDIHVIAGYTAATVVAIRIVWGFVGTRHARFSSFVRGPGSVFGYLAGLVSGKSGRHVGHNPAGAAMILALLLGVAGTATSGMALLAAEEGEGPLAGFISAEAAPRGEGRAPEAGYEGEEESGDDEGREHAAGTGESEEDGRGEGGGQEELFEGVHKAFVYFTLGLIGLHVLGVIASSLAHRENLVGAMITGRKRAED